MSLSFCLFSTLPVLVHCQSGSKKVFCFISVHVLFFFNRAHLAMWVFQGGQETVARGYVDNSKETFSVASVLPQALNIESCVERLNLC